jgi:perosamine synthetase
MYKEFVHFVRELYQSNDFIPLHAPIFQGNEKKYLLDTIDSTFVSSVGKCVDRFEQVVAEYTRSEYAIATVNGTSALHIALKLAGVEPETEVITQSLTFVATCNAISYCQADPVFVDVDLDTLGLSPNSMGAFLREHAEIRDDGYCWNKTSNKKITACLPMHTFGFPVRLDEINQVCNHYNIALVEDAAESLGSFYKGQHTGIIGKTAAISFNGNKIITTGAGGMILTNDTDIAKRAKHLTTTAKVPHQWAFVHDEVGYNYRLPNLNAALGVAQMETLPNFLEAKRKIAMAYQQWGSENGVKFIKEPESTSVNYWLNTLVAEDENQRDEWLQQTNERGVMTRPAWLPMHRLEIHRQYKFANLPNTTYLYDRLINVPSSVIYQ